MKIKTLIVDDEFLARERVRLFLAPLEEYEIVGEAKDGIEAVEMIEDKKPELVLLDIQMPKLNGFEVLQMLKNPPLCIFATAFEEYAIEAFEMNALDYLLKPFNRERFYQALDKAKRIIKEKKEFAFQFEQLFKTLNQKAHYMDKIGVRKKERIVILDVKDIDWFEADKELIFAHVKDVRHLINCSLSQLEKRLNPDIFFRCHRSAIVNLSCIKEIHPWFSGSHRIILNDGTLIPLSRSRAKVLKKIIQW